MGKKQNFCGLLWEKVCGSVKYYNTFTVCYSKWAITCRRASMVHLEFLLGFPSQWSIWFLTMWWTNGVSMLRAMKRSKLCNSGKIKWSCYAAASNQSSAVSLHTLNNVFTFPTPALKFMSRLPTFTEPSTSQPLLVNTSAIATTFFSLSLSLCFTSWHSALGTLVDWWRWGSVPGCLPLTGKTSLAHFLRSSLH